MIDSLQIWVSTPYFVLLTFEDSWNQTNYTNIDNPYGINISYTDVVTDLQVNYRLVIYSNIDENHSAKLVSSFKEICANILV